MSVQGEQVLVYWDTHNPVKEKFCKKCGGPLKVTMTLPSGAVFYSCENQKYNSDDYYFHDSYSHQWWYKAPDLYDAETGRRL